MISYSIIIPFQSEHICNVWCPSDATGAFSTLVRGSFATTDAAHTWAAANIPGVNYTLRTYGVLSTTRVYRFNAAQSTDASASSWIVSLDGTPEFVCETLSDALSLCDIYRAEY